MDCAHCKQYESSYMFNRCNITGDECFFKVDNCDLVDENGEDNGRWLKILEGKDDGQRTD